MNNQAFRLALLAIPLLSTLVFSPRLTMEQYELPKQTALFIMIAIMVAASPGFFSPRRWLNHPALVFFLAAAIISASISLSPLISIAGDNENLEGVFTWLTYALLFLAGNALADSSGRRLAVGVGAAAAFGAFYGIFQSLGLDPFRGGYFLHIRAFAGNPDFLAQQMAMALPLALGYAISRRAFSGAMLTALFACILLLTASRAGTLAGIAGASLLLWWLRDIWRPWKNVLKWVGIPILLVLFFASESMVAPELSLRSRISAGISGQGFTAARGMLWSGVSRVIRANPLTGSGTDTLKTSFLRHAPNGYASLEGLGSSARKAHNEPLHFWATMGIIGLSAYLWLLACAAKSVRLGLREPLKAAVTAAVCAYLIHNLFSFGTAGSSPIFWIFLGFISSRRKDKPLRTSSRIWSFILSTVMVLIAAWGMARFTADGFAYRGNEESLAGRDAGSAEWFARAYTMAPYEITYLVRWAGGLESSGRKAEALPLFERAWSMNRTNGILLGNAGRVAFAMTPTMDTTAREIALNRLIMAAELAPTQPSLYGAVIMALQDMKRMPERDDWIRRLQIADPVWAARLLGGNPPP